MISPQTNLGISRTCPGSVEMLLGHQIIMGAVLSEYPLSLMESQSGAANWQMLDIEGTFANYKGAILGCRSHFEVLRALVEAH